MASNKNFDDLSNYRDIFGSELSKEFQDDDEVNPATTRKTEINLLQKRIARKLKRYSQSDHELVGEPNYLISPKELIPITALDDNGNFNALGGSSSRKIMDDLEQTEIEKTFRYNRYKRLMKTIESPEGEGILMVYADESTTEDAAGDIIHVLHPDEAVKEDVTDLFKRCDIYNRAWTIVYNMCGYGDEFYDVIPAISGDRIAKMEWIPRDKIERVEENNILKGFKILNTAPNQDSSDYGLGLYSTYQYLKKDEDEEEDEENLIFPFRVLHFRIPSDKYMPYGKSILDAIVSPIEQLNLMIKAMLIARVSRAPERRVFHIDVGNLQGEIAIKYAHDAVNFLKRKKQLDLARGNATASVDLVRDSFGATEDIVIPKRAGSEGNSIDTLPAAAGLDQIADIDFLNNRIFPSTGVPKEYLYDNQFTFVNSNLSSKSVIFAKRVRRVQRFFLNQLYKLVAIELKLRGYSNENIDKVTLMMNNPSNIDENEKIDIDTKLWGLITQIRGNNAETIFYPDYLMYKYYLKMDDEEIVELLKLAQLQAAGENIFKFMPEEDRPEGARDLGTPSAGAGGNVTMGTEAGDAGGEPGAEGAEGAEGEAGVGIPQEVTDAMGTPPEAENADVRPDMMKQDLFFEATERKLRLIKKLQFEQENVMKQLQVVQAEKILKKKTILHDINLSLLEGNGELEGLDTMYTIKKEYYSEENKEK